MKGVDRRWLWLVLVVVVVIAAFLSTSRRRSGPPFDPESTDSDGARGLVVFFEESGIDVDVTDEVPAAGERDVVFVLEDRMPSEQAAAVEAFAREGGIAVIADGSSQLSPSSSSMDKGTLEGTCTDGSLSEVTELEVTSVVRGFGVDDLESVVACFTVDGVALVVAESIGDGQIISVGDPHMFTNEWLDEADNAVLAAAVVGGNGASVTFLTPERAAVGAGDRNLIDLIPDPVKTLGWQTVVVFALVVAWKGRRLGRPVLEPQPVSIDGSELTRAVGRLLEGNERPDRAAALLRDRARTDLAHRLGLAPDATAASVAAALERATTLTEAEIATATVAPVTTDDALLVVARLLSRIREEVLYGHHPTPR